MVDVLPKSMCLGLEMSRISTIRWKGRNKVVRFHGRYLLDVGIGDTGCGKGGGEQ